MDTNNINERVAWTNGKPKLDLECFSRHFNGHCIKECSYVGRIGANFAHIRYILTQDGTPADIPKLWLILDTCPTACVNDKLVTSIRKYKSDAILTAITNGDLQFYAKMEERIMFLISVHFRKESMAAILF